MREFWKDFLYGLTGGLLGDAWRSIREREPPSTPYSEWAKGEAAEMLRRMPTIKHKRHCAGGTSCTCGDDLR